MARMNTLYLKKGEEKRLKIGHLWVFSNEIDTKRSPLKGLEPGGDVRIESARGDFVGNAYVNPGSLICARMIARKPSHVLNAELLHKRLKQALELRETLFDVPYYRLAFAEADFLPGLVVDRFGDILSVQTTTAGMERVRDDIVEVLVDLVRPRGVLLKNDAGGRQLEGLASYVETAYGEVPDETEVLESGAKFVVPLKEGQKTGWFYDMRLNRQRFCNYVEGKSVLDVFSYVGAVGVMSRLAGAKRAVCVDASQLALDYAERSAGLSGVAEGFETEQGDAFKVFEQLREAGEKFDVVSVDPPAFIKGKKDQKKGEQAYAKVNREALKLVKNGGILMSCSCSQHMQADDLRKALTRAAQQRKVRLQILEQGHQGPDHPFHPAMPETNYLKAFICRVLK